MMRASRWLVLLGATCIAGCAAPARMGATISPTPQMDESRLIILAVENPGAKAPPAPGTTRRGYGGGTYSAGSAALAMMKRLAKQYELVQVDAWPIAALKMHCAVFRIPAGASRDELLSVLAMDRRVQLAQPMNGFSSRSEPYNDPYLGVQSGFRSIDAAAAQKWSRGERIRVAVIDTGIDAAHPDFGGRVRVRRNFVDQDERRFGRDRHGTEVAGVISASANNSLGIVGVAPEVEIIALKACWQLQENSDAARCNSLTLAQALAAAMDEQAQVVNLSLTGPSDPLLNALVSAGAARGILYVGAAPHDGDPRGFPAGAPEVIPVDTAQSDQTRKGVLRAPGVDVVTLMPGGHYDFVSGASLATAHVTGTIALMLARARQLDRATAYSILLRSEDDGSGSAQSAAVTPINACMAVAQLVKQATCAMSHAPASGTLPATVKE